MKFKQAGPHGIMSWGGNSLGKPQFLLDFQVWSKLWNMSYILAVIPNMWDTCFLVLEYKSKVQLQWETYFDNELEIYQTKIYLLQKLPTSAHMHSYTATATYSNQFLDLLHVVWKIINKSVTGGDNMWVPTQWLWKHFPWVKFQLCCEHPVSETASWFKNITP